MKIKENKGGATADINGSIHTGNQDSKTITKNNEQFDGIDRSKGEDNVLLRYGTPVLKDPSIIVKIAENGLKAIGVIAGVEIANQVENSSQDSDDVPTLDDAPTAFGGFLCLIPRMRKKGRKTLKNPKALFGKIKKMKNEGNGIRSIGKGKKTTTIQMGLHS